ncbi:MAG: hypothetical protein LBU94_01445 [Clostridiales bacterium]|nr:hypothetical protein [Clostridiales bacterium]
MAIYFKHTHTVTQIVPYKFTCEHCGKNSGILDAAFEGKSVHTTKRIGPIDEDDKESLRKRALEILENELEYAKKDFDKGIFDTHFKDKCPHCGKPQSWSVGGMAANLPSTYALSCGGWGIIIGFLIFVMEGWFIGDDAALIFKILLAIVMAIVLGFIGYMFGRFRVSIKKARTKNVSNNQVPVINWAAIAPPQASAISSEKVQ